MPGSSLGGFTEGLWGSIAAGRKEAADREEAAARREAQLLTTLAGSDDPEIASMAIAGMLEQASPKRKAKGLRGFLGEMEASATLPRIRELLATPVQSQVTTPGLPSRGIPQALTMRGAPPGGPPVAQAAPPPTGLPAVLPQSQIATGEPPPAPGDAFRERRGTPEVGRVDTVMRPRQVFLQPDERLRRDTIAREQAEIEGRVAGDIAAGFTREQSLAMLKAERERKAHGVGRGGQLQKQAVEIPKPDGSTEVMFAIFDPIAGKFFDPDSNEVILNARPVSSSARMSFGIEAERAARAKYNKSFGQLNQAEADDIVNNELPKIAGQISGARATETGKAQNVTKLNAPLSVDDAAQLNVGVGTAMADVKGQVPQTPQMQELRRSITGMKAMLPTALAAVTAALPSANDSVIANLAPGLVMKKRRLDPAYREKIAAAEASVNLLVNNIARVVAGAKGAQSEPDALRAESALMNLKEGWINGDTAESAAARFKVASEAIEKVLATLPPEMVAGAPPPGPGAPAPQQPTEYTPGLKYVHPVYGLVEVLDPPLNAQGKPRVKRVAGPSPVPR